MIPNVKLDHVAVAAEHIDLIVPMYGHHLSGRWLSGGGTGGFYANQYGFEGGTVETIMPFGVEHDDFLQRFLERTGPGPHHFTFKVPDLVGAKTVLEDAGYRLPVVRFDIPGIEEIFVHPKDA